MPILAKNGTFLVKVFDEDIDDNGIYVIPNSVIEIKPFAFYNNVILTFISCIWYYTTSTYLVNVFKPFQWTHCA